MFYQLGVYSVYEGGEACIIPRAVPPGTSAPGRFNHVGLVEADGPDKESALILQVGSLAQKLPNSMVTSITSFV